MKWKKHGVVWQPEGNRAWARSHATCPTPVWRADGTLRLYVQCRDGNNVGRVGFVDVDPEDPRRVLQVARVPVLDIGKPGCFDDNGVFQTSVVRLDDGRLFMYYVGFELSYHIRYRLLTGLAVSEDDGDSFKRIKPTPILERSATEMHFRCGPFVLPATEARPFRMWYVAGGSWMDVDGKPMPVYDLRYVESEDGVDWPSQGMVSLSMGDNEHGFGRPYVVEKEDGFQLFYSIRKIRPNAYRMGYAESSDGINWERRDNELGLDVSLQGWDSESVEYAAVIESDGRTWMFYNGNDFGGAGFGVAELISD